MQLNISFKHMDPSDQLRDHVTEKSERLKKYFRGRISVTWNLDSEKQQRSAHCHLLGNHMDYFGHAEAGDFRSAIDQAFEKIERQIRKHKEIVKNHLHRSPKNRKRAA